MQFVQVSALWQNVNELIHFSKTISYIRLKFSQTTEIAILIPYLYINEKIVYFTKLDKRMKGIC